MKRLALLLSFVCVVSVAANAIIALPTWNVGDPGTTCQQWSFDTPQNISAPDAGFLNPNGLPQAEVAPSAFSGSVNWQQGAGAWVGTKFSITIDIPNFPPPNPYKEVLVELIYKGQIVLSWVKDNAWMDFAKTSSMDYDLGNGWKKRVDLWYIAPNPLSERVCYGFNPEVTGAESGIDSIKISTICIPEPMTLAILGLGMVALLKKK